MKKSILIFSIFYLFSCAQEIKTIDYVPVIVEESNKKIHNDSKIIKLKSEIITNINAKRKLEEYGKKNLETKVLMKTTYGNMKIRLYNKTPLHRANFIMLTKKKYFDSTLFYRVIKKFMIQGGNSDDEEINNKMLSIGSYRIPNEINQNYAHTKGAIAMAVSPEEQQFGKKSSAFNFYIIQGQKLSQKYLKNIESRGVKITPKNKEKYLKIGGAPHLDGNYTVFGEVYEGFGVLSKISKVKTTEGDWPKKPVYIKSVKVIE